MRHLPTVLAFVLVLILAAAIVAPPFIDWSTQRTYLEQRIGAALGGRLQLAGAIDLRLLPQPRFSAAQASFERPGLVVAARQAAFELSLGALLRGNFRFMRAQLEAPTISVQPALAAQSARAVAPDFFSVDRISLRDATLRVEDASRLELRGLDVDGVIDSPIGPFRGEGLLRQGAVARPFQFVSAPAESGSSLELVFAATEELPEVKLKGLVSASGDQLGFSGVGAAQGVFAADHGTAPWRARFNATLAGGRAALSDFTIEAGEEAALLAAKGEGEWSASGGLRLNLAAAHWEMDAFAARYGWPSETPNALSSVSVQVAAARLAREDIRDVIFARSVLPAKTALRFAARLPGDALIQAQGESVAPSKDMSGRLQFTANHPDLTSAWLERVAPAAAPLLQLSQGRPISLQGQISWRGDQVALDDLEARFGAGDSVYRGAAAWTPPRASAPAFLRVSLRTDALDVSAAPDLTGLSRMGALDFDIALEASSAHATGDLQSGRVALQAQRRGAAIVLPSISIENLAGAQLRGEAKWAQDTLSARFDLVADKLDAFAKLAHGLWPNFYTRHFLAQAGAFAPARLTISAQRAPKGALVLSAGGSTGGARVEVDWRDGQAHARLVAPQASQLLRQLGLDAGAPAGAASLHFEMRDAKDGKPSLTARFEAPGLQINAYGAGDIAGRAQNSAGEFNARFDRLDQWPAFAQAGAGAAQASGGFVLDNDGLWLRAIKGAAGANTFSGDLRFMADSGVTGALRCDAADVETLAAALLGARLRAGAEWSQQPFAHAALPLTGALDLDVGRLTFGATQVEAARARLVFGGQGVRVENFGGRWQGGPIGGQFNFARSAMRLDLAGRLAGRDLRASLPPFTGRVAFEADIAGAGANWRDLILALGGAGRLDVTEGALARAQPLAIAQTAQVFEQRDDNFAPDEARNVLSQKFDDGALAIGALFAPVSIYGGAIHATNIDARMNGVLAQLSARYQLEDGAFDLEARLRAPKLDGWDEPPPIVALLWRNGARRIEAEGLTQALLLRALAREVERKAAFDADVRERAAFNRRAKADKFIARRRKEEADFLADRAQAAASRPAQQPPSLKSDPSPSGLY